MKKKMALIKTDYEEGRLQPIQVGYPQQATPLFLYPHDILKKRIRKKSWKLKKKDLAKKWPRLRQTMKKGNCSRPQLATPSWPPQRGNHFLLVSLFCFQGKSMFSLFFYREKVCFPDKN
jgi:hypothetical protein